MEASSAEGAVLETLVLSILNHDSAIASAASRMTSAAGVRPCIEMGSRRTHEQAADCGAEHEPESEGDTRSQAGSSQGRSHTKAGSGSATDKPLAERRSEVLIDSSGIEAGPSVLDPETETFGVHDPGTTKYEGDVEATSNEEEK